MVDLYWIPLGAGGHSVRFNGRVYEAIAAAWGRRARRDLYHAALVVDGQGIELGPSPDGHEADRGVVATGPVGSRRLRPFRLFRYEVRCGVTIPDLADAVGGPRRVSDDPLVAERLLRAVRAAPTYTWGRDELRTGEMWNSNSLVAWLLAASGVPMADLHPPPGGRAPGWNAGVALAQRGRIASVAWRRSGWCAASGSPTSATRSSSPGSPTRS
jgi:hypothetical protein